MKGIRDMDYLDILSLEKQKDYIYAPKEEKVCFCCDKCKEEIYYGQEYYKTDFGYVCEKCFDEIQLEEKRECERIAGDDDED